MKDWHMFDENNGKNTILAIALSIMIIILWQVFYVNPKLETERRAAEAEIALKEKAERAKTGDTSVATDNIPAASDNNIPQAGPTSSPVTIEQTREAAISNASRIEIDTGRLIGSLNLKGARFDDLRLKDYRETLDKTSPLIVLLNPSETENGYFAEFGWVGSDNSGKVPGPATQWQGSGTLTPTSPVTLTWVNDKGLTFRRQVAIDENYLFTITDEIVNGSGQATSLSPL